MTNLGWGASGGLCPSGLHASSYTGVVPGTEIHAMKLTEGRLRLTVPPTADPATEETI